MADQSTEHDEGPGWFPSGSRLLDDLPKLLTSATGGIDFEASDAAVVQRVAEAAENTLFVIHQGVRAIGLLMGNFSPTTDDLVMRDEVVNDLGALLAHLGDVGTSLSVTAMFARQATADYVPPTANQAQATA
ncbi:MAG: hypothetical protein KF686_17170 [Ramlibacter sp.]|nr:hypothetical protein [Ramlibacter sp.]